MLKYTHIYKYIYINKLYELAWHMLGENKQKQVPSNSVPNPVFWELAEVLESGAYPITQVYGQESL